MWFWYCPECGCYNGGGDRAEEHKCDRCSYILKPLPKKPEKIKKVKCKNIYYDKIIEYRKQGLTYQEIGNLIGYTKQYIYKIANCK